jgi:hypothetical protein
MIKLDKNHTQLSTEMGIVRKVTTRDTTKNKSFIRLDQCTNRETGSDSSDWPPITGGQSIRVYAATLVTFMPCTSLNAPEVALGHQTLRRRSRICKAVVLRVLLPSDSLPFKIPNNLCNDFSAAAGSKKPEKF